MNTPMTDTSELLRLCDDVLFTEPKGDETLGEIKDICTLARALKSRLQAEAPEDAEVDVDLQELSDEIRDAINGWLATLSKEARDALTLENETFLYASFLTRMDTLLRPFQSRTSQAEAQAPTTASSVLTYDVPFLESLARQFALKDDLRTANRLEEIIHRLTVGAPAPAPTMPTREQIAAAAYRAFRTPHPLQNPPYTSDELKIADAILALFARQGL